MAKRGLLRCLVAVVFALCACSAPVKGPLNMSTSAAHDFASVRGVAWTNTAKDITNGQVGSYMIGLGPDPDGPSSVASSGVVVSAATTGNSMFLAGQSARTGKIVWRAAWPDEDTQVNPCIFDEQGGTFGCDVDKGDSSTLWIFKTRTGTVLKKIPIGRARIFAISGQDLYLVTLDGARRSKNLKVTLERRLWGSGRNIWTSRTSIPHGEVFEFGPELAVGENRATLDGVGLHIAWDRRTGQLLERSNNGFGDRELDRAGRVAINYPGQGQFVIPDHTTFTVRLFSPEGRQVARFKDSNYPGVVETGRDQVAIGRRILSQSTGHTIFAAPPNTQITAVTDSGRSAIVEPEPLHLPDEAIPMTVYNTATGKKTGSVTLHGHYEQMIFGGNGVVHAVLRDGAPTSIEIVDARKPARVASIKVGTNAGESPTFVKTSTGFVATGSVVRGFLTH